MRKLAFALVSILISFTYADSAIRQHVRENLRIIGSIQPQHTDFSDLSAIGEAIGDARVVLLGEQCHGDGATFTAKSRLIKYLHQNKGFTVIAFEADFFSLNDALNEPPKGINNIWTEAEECRDLLQKYIPATSETDNPLAVTGIDNQFYGQIDNSRLKDFLRTSVNPTSFTQDISHLMDAPFYRSLDSLMSSLIKTRKQLLNLSPSYISLLNQFGHSLANILARANPNSNGFDLQVIKNIRATNELILKGINTNVGAVRDSMMAENVQWLINNKFRNQKIIVWAANSHICKQKYQIYSPRPFRPMGTFLEQKFRKEEIYAIAFTSREGSHGIFRTSHITKPLTRSLENWIPDEVDYAFFDLKKREDLASESFTMRAIGHGNLKMNWQTKFDGIFYIKEMSPSHRTKR